MHFFTRNPKTFNRRVSQKIIETFYAAVLTGLFLHALAGPAAAQYLELDALADVKTKFSSGCSSVQELANVARQRGLDAVFFSDSDRHSLEEGIWPLENILKDKQEYNSVSHNGAAAYWSAIKLADESFKDLLLIPGVESAPFYFWGENAGGAKRTAHNWDKHLWIVGLTSALDYDALPTLHGNFSTRYSAQFSNLFLIYLAAFLVVAFAAYKKKERRRWLAAGAFFILLLTINNLPFRSSPFDPYHGDQGVRPYQEVIDYANSKGAMTFWNHVDANKTTDLNGWGTQKTLPHPEDLALTNDYVGFEAVYPGKSLAAEQGNEWDRALIRFIRGEQKNPVWAYGGSDFECEGKDGRTLGSYRTVLLAQEKTQSAAMDALRKGRMYAVRQSKMDNRLALAKFGVRDAAGTREALMGEELLTETAPTVTVELRAKFGGQPAVPAKAIVIRNGKIAHEASGVLPLKISWKDDSVLKKGRAYYRIRAEVGGEDYLLSNPVFVRFGKEKTQVASLPQAGAPVAASAQAPLRRPEGAGEPEEKKENRNVPRFDVDFSKPQTSAKPQNRETKTPPPASQPVVQPAPGEKELQYAVARIDGLALKKGPGLSFPQIASAQKGERLELIRTTSAMYNDKPWLEVRKGALKLYVWSPLVSIE